MELIELYRKVQEYGEICDHCLGRLVAKRSHGLSNDMRGKAIRIFTALEANEPYSPPTEPCWICNNFFDHTKEWAERVVSALDGIECTTFLIGSKVPPLIAE
ncbi:MAG: tRNA pseudouridine(54/55) synthase Pus10, partial [Methanomicrobiales archaeon HGW-Methanomicrobiales-4]